MILPVTVVASHNVDIRLRATVEKSCGLNGLLGNGLQSGNDILIRTFATNMYHFNGISMLVFMLTFWMLLTCPMQCTLSACPWAKIG